MYRFKKINILRLVFVCLLFLNTLLFASFFFPKQPPPQRQLGIPIAGSVKVEKEYGKIDKEGFSKYIKQIIKSPYTPPDNYILSFKKTSFQQNKEIISLKTYPWAADDDTTVTLELTQGLKGIFFNRDGKTLDYTIFIIKRKDDQRYSLNSLLRDAPKYFNIPTEIIFDHPKEFEAQIGGRVLEVTWKNKDLNAIESVSIWDTKSNSIIYTSCRIFNTSPLYKKNTCYIKK